MPTGIPKDPIAYAEKQALASQKRAAAKAANGGKPLKRTYKKRVSPSMSATATQTAPVEAVPDEVDDIPLKRVHKRRTPSSAKDLSGVMDNARDKIIKKLEADLAKLQERYDGCEKEWEAMQERALDAERRLMAVLDLI